MKTIDQRRDERKKWSDERLTADLANAAAGERSSLVELLLDLVEFDHRSLSQKGAYHTLFDYCTRKLGYSSSEAGRRIAVARKSERVPLLLEMLERGELHLSGAAMLAGLLTPENHSEVLRRAKGLTQDEIGRLVAALAPKPAPRDRIRALSAPAVTPIAAPALAAPISTPQNPTAPAPASPTPAPSAPAVPIFAPPAAIPEEPPFAPTPLPAVPAPLLAPPEALPPQPAAATSNPAAPKPREPLEDLFLVSFPATLETRELIDRAKDVLRHRIPKAELDKIFNLALKTCWRASTGSNASRRGPPARRPPARSAVATYPRRSNRRRGGAPAGDASSSPRTARAARHAPGSSSTTRSPTPSAGARSTTPTSEFTAGPTTPGRPSRSSVRGKEEK